MKKTFLKSDSLENIYNSESLPFLLKDILNRTKTVQERAETSLLSSLRAKSSFPEWIAGLILLNPQVKIDNEQTSSMVDLFKNNPKALRNIESLTISVDETMKFDWTVLSATPRDQIILSILFFVSINGKQISECRLIATGISNEPIFVSDIPQEIIGKEFNEKALLEVAKELKDEVDPDDTYLASANYKKEMVEVLTKRLISKTLHGVIK